MRKRGFTLIELVVTLAVLALLAMATMPSIADWLRNARLRNMTESIQTGIQQARSEAVRRNRDVTFWLVNLPTAGVLDNTCTLSNGSNANGWVVSVDDPSGQCGAANSTTVTPMIAARAATPGAAGVSVTASNVAANAAASSVTFSGIGRVVTSAGTPARNLDRIVMAYASANAEDRPLQLDLDVSGGVRRCDLAVTDTSDQRACPAGSLPDPDSGSDDTSEEQ